MLYSSSKPQHDLSATVVRDKMSGMPLSDEKIIAALRLAHVPGVGPVSYRRLVRAFGSAQAVPLAAPDKLAAISDLSPAALKNLAAAADDPWAEEELKRAKDKGYRIFCLDDPDYPPALSKTSDPPPILYAAGELKPEDAIAVGIVGTRRNSRYGRKMAEELAAALAAAGCTVVSGLARGIDTFAHQGALTIERGRTLCVMGNGLGVVYPPENRELCERIVGGRGAALSELPIGTQPAAGNFPRRNRIIAGLTLGVVVIEGDVDSGALITARYAVDMDREVFAVPGLVDSPNSRGPHRLIKAGAKLVENVGDILEELRPALEPLIKPARLDARLRTPSKTAPPQKTSVLFEPTAVEPDPRPSAADLRASVPGTLSDRERRIFDLLDPTVARGVDELIQESNFPAQEVLGILLVLEIRRLCRQMPGKRFVKES